MSNDKSKEYGQFTHTIRVGSMEVSTILDGKVVKESIKPPFLIDRSELEVAEIAKKADLPADRLDHGFVPVVVRTENEVVLFDTGFGETGIDGKAGQLTNCLSALGITRNQVDVVAFTHMHPDHILGVSNNKGSPSFPNARYVVGRKEFDEWKSGNNIPEQRMENRNLFLKIIEPLAEHFTFLEPGEQIVSGISAEAGFGHSPGHMMYRIESGSEQILLWGDICNHYIYSLQHPNSIVAFDDDPDAAIKTRNRVLSMVSDDNLLVAGFHMPFPSVGTVERFKDSFIWVPRGEM